MRALLLVLGCAITLSAAVLAAGRARCPDGCTARTEAVFIRVPALLPDDVHG